MLILTLKHDHTSTSKGGMSSCSIVHAAWQPVHDRPAHLHPACTHGYTDGPCSRPPIANAQRKPKIS